MTPVGGLARAGLIYVDDSETALQAVRRALYAHGLLLETFASLELARPRLAQPVAAALLDVDLGDGVSGLDVASEVRRASPSAAIAFITADGRSASEAERRAYGPTFNKERDLAAAVAWLREHAVRTG